MKTEYRKIFWKAGQEITPETFIQADHCICAQQNLIRKLLNRQWYGLEPEEITYYEMLMQQKITVRSLLCIPVSIKISA